MVDVCFFHLEIFLVQNRCLYFMITQAWKKIATAGLPSLNVKETYGVPIDDMGHVAKSFFLTVFMVVTAMFRHNAL